MGTDQLPPDWVLRNCPRMMISPFVLCRRTSTSAFPSNMKGRVVAVLFHIGKAGKPVPWIRTRRNKRSKEFTVGLWRELNGMSESWGSCHIYWITRCRSVLKASWVRTIYERERKCFVNVTAFFWRQNWDLGKREVNRELILKMFLSVLDTYLSWVLMVVRYLILLIFCITVSTCLELPQHL